MPPTTWTITCGLGGGIGEAPRHSTRRLIEDSHGGMSSNGAFPFSLLLFVFPFALLRCSRIVKLFALACAATIYGDNSLGDYGDRTGGPSNGWHHVF